MYTVPLDIQNSTIEGRGYFATTDIPLGTIVYFYGESDIRYSPEQFEKLEPDVKKRVMDFAVEDEFGNWVETSTGAFTNHSCDPNIMPIFINGIYFDIAIKDIKKGEEITIDYSLFFSSQKWQMECHCGSNNCRHFVGFGLEINPDVEKMWQQNLNLAVANINNIAQPLFDLTDKLAINLTSNIKSILNPVVFKYNKFSLIHS